MHKKILIQFITLIILVFIFSLSAQAANVKMLVAYTDSVVYALGSETEVKLLIDSCMQKTYDIFSRSDAEVDFDLAATLRIHYKEQEGEVPHPIYGDLGDPKTRWMEKDLDELQKGEDPELKKIHMLRESVGADIVVLLTNQDNYSGQTYEINCENYENAFCVVDYETANENNRWTFTHEIGHIFGGGHEDDPGEGNGGTVHYPYAHAWITGTRTIMEGKKANRIPYFSNPDKSYNGITIGSEEYEDNARVIEYNRDMIANLSDDPVVINTTSLNAISENGSRNFVKSGDHYFAVFEDGGDIYYAKSINGLRWEQKIKISDHNGNNRLFSRFPAMAERNGNLYFVWHEEYDDDESYTRLKYRCLYNGQLNDIIDLTEWWWADEEDLDPLNPTIAVSAYPHTFEMTIAYRAPVMMSGANIITISTTDVQGEYQYWSNFTPVPGSAHGDNPVLVYNNYSFPYTKLYWSDGDHIYYSSSYYSYGVNWSSNPMNLSSHIEVDRDSYHNNNPTAAVTSNHNMFTAWEGEDLLGYDVLYCVKNNSPSIYHEFGNYSAYLRPSITGHANGTATMTWYDDSGLNNVRKAYYNGSTWDAGMGWWGEGWGEIIAEHGKDPSISISNPPGDEAKIMWLNTEIQPYSLKIRPFSFQKSINKNAVYHRRIIARNRLNNNTFAIELGEFVLRDKDNSEISSVSFADINEDDIYDKKMNYNDMLATKAFKITDDLQELSFYSLYVSEYKDAETDPIEVRFRFVDYEKEVEYATLKTDLFNSSTKIIENVNSTNIAALNNKTVKIVPEVFGIDDIQNYEFTLVHVYNEIERSPLFKHTHENFIELHTNAETIENQFIAYNYPNPFNPSTKIHFFLPHKERVKIEVFNALGQKVAILLNEIKEIGRHEIVFNAESTISSGIYFYVISAGENKLIKKMMLLK